MGKLSDTNTTEVVEVDEKPLNKRKPWAIWEVNGKEYKLKLTSSSIIDCENKIGANLLNVVAQTENGTLPALKIMLLITHKALQKFHHGIDEDDVIDMFDQYCDDGGNQLSFLTEVFLPIFQVSGFFSKAQTQKMVKTLDRVKEQN